jgi:hypothetical protein
LRHGLPARITVGAPEVKDDDIAFEIRKRDLLTTESDEAEF